MNLFGIIFFFLGTCLLLKQWWNCSSVGLVIGPLLVIFWLWLICDLWIRSCMHWAVTYKCTMPLLILLFYLCAKFCDCIGLIPHTKMYVIFITCKNTFNFLALWLIDSLSYLNTRWYYLSFAKLNYWKQLNFLNWLNKFCDFD